MEMKRAVGSVLLLISFGMYTDIVLSQQKLNTNFEILSIEGTSRPWLWETDGYSQVETVLDDSIKTEGKYSLRLSSGDSGDSESLSYYIIPFELRNKQLTLEGSMKSENISDSVYFALGYGMGDEENPDVYSTISPVISGTQDWKRFSISLDIPEVASLVYIKVAMRGQGVCWFDDFKLLHNETEIAEVAIGPEFSKKQLKWINKRCSSLQKWSPEGSAELSSEMFRDLATFGDGVKDARIIALGEATHGTSEFFRMKHRVLQYAVEELGVRIFALEDNQLIVERVNRYVQGGSGTARSSMYGIFSISQNEEVHDLIKWTREYNDLHPQDKIQFVGFDMQNVYPALDSLKGFVDRYHPGFRKEIDSLLVDFEQNISSMYYADEDQKKRWKDNASKVFEFISSKEQTLKIEFPTKQFDIAYGTQFARLILQYLDNAILGHASLYRDVAMSENVQWILDNYANNAKMLIWAHDYHVSLGESEDTLANIYGGKSMGAHLRKQFGEGYKSFSLATYDGAYSGQRSYVDFTQVACPLYPAPKSTLDYALHRACLKQNTSTLYFNLSKARNKKWLSSKRHTRFANHVNIEFGYYTSYSVPYQFDGILFIDQTTPARSY